MQQVDLFIQQVDFLTQTISETTQQQINQPLAACNIIQVDLSLQQVIYIPGLTWDIYYPGNYYIYIYIYYILYDYRRF